MAPLKYKKKSNLFKIEETFYCLLKCLLCSLKLFGKFDIILAGLKKYFWLVKDLERKKKWPALMARLITPFFFSKLDPFFAKLSAVFLWNDCSPSLWAVAKGCAPICLCRSWQPGWLQNVCVEEPRALLGRVLIAGWQRAGELGGGRGCSVLGKSRFGELIWSSNEPSPHLLYLQYGLDCCWDVWHL